MTFAHLRPLGKGYSDEQGKEGHRRDALGSLETLLLKRYAESDKARVFARSTQVATGLPSGAGRVRALAAFHQQQQQKSTAEEKINEQIIRFRQWLHRQHAKLMPDGRIDWSRSVRQVEYDNDIRKQAATRISVQGGLLITGDGKPFDTTRMVTMFSGPGNAIYVMSPDGHFHVSSHSVGYRHHSSLLAGASVGGAGEMCVREGRLVWISNKSGHYHPLPINLLQTLLSLARQGYGAHMRVVCMYADGSQLVFPGPRDFCIHHKFDDEVVKSVDVIAAYEMAQRDAYSAYNAYAVSPHSLYGQYTAVTPRADSGNSYAYHSSGYTTYNPSGSTGTSQSTTSTSSAGYGQYTPYFSSYTASPPTTPGATSAPAPGPDSLYSQYSAPFTGGAPAPRPPSPPPALDLSAYQFYAVNPVPTPDSSLPSGYGFYSVSLPPAPTPTAAPVPGSSSTTAPGPVPYGAYSWSP